MSQTAFSTLKLHPDLLTNLSSLGYDNMTPIQAQSLPPILAGQDVIGQGKTGSGKTAAFGLGLLQKLDVSQFRVQALVLCPTRELADQVATEIRKLARAIHNIKVLTLCGGSPIGPQIGSLEHGAHIVVGTPGRIEDHLRKRTLMMGNVTTLVLDEADRMLEMGFQPTLDAIIADLPRQRQTLLFSATYPDAIQAIADRVMIKPVMAQVASSHDEKSIRQHFYRVSDNEQRMLALRLLILQHQPESTLIFCVTRQQTEEVAEALRSYGFSALALHGDLEQRERDQTLVRFANRSIAIVVATDVAARGLDIEALDAVINYHIARDIEVHVHRIGRTGRAGSQGIACSLFSDKESYKLSLLEALSGQPIIDESLPPLSVLERTPKQPSMATLQIDGGKKQKLRPGDILGALTSENGITGQQVGKIQVADNRAFVAVNRKAVKPALRKLSEGKLKGRSFRVRLLPDQHS
ncbi:MAG: ATP-dependent RNA helicase DbpA [Gammaproteobacteria bacterium]|nr:ATP-dependent RNA helicase DbpA [Gammaproteobacteria bacterium]